MLLKSQPKWSLPRSALQEIEKFDRSRLRSSVSEDRPSLSDEIKAFDKDNLNKIVTREPKFIFVSEAVAAEIEQIETQEEPVVLSNSDLSEELKSPDLESSENERQDIEKRTTDTSEGATTDIDTMKNIAENENDENKTPEEETALEETVEIKTAEIETIEISNSDLSEPSKSGTIVTDGPITMSSEIETPEIETTKIEENETVHDDQKLPETINEETSESKAQNNLEPERKILKEVQHEKNMQSSAKKGKILKY